MESLKTLLKYGAVIGAIVLIVLLGKWGLESIYKSAEESNSAPTNPAEATRQFFTALYNQDYETCYACMTGTRKMATLIGKASRDDYFDMFGRVRFYLIEHAGENFLQEMQVPDSGGVADFTNNVQLRLKLQSVVARDKLAHYNIAELTDFPMDVAPAIGIEQHNRQMDRIVQDINKMNVAEPDNPQEVIRQREGESRGDRLQRIISGFREARHLDTRHTLLGWIIKEFPLDKPTAALLMEVLNDETQPPQLRQLAKQTLIRLQSQPVPAR